MNHPMNTLQCLSHQEQMDAHRAEFNAWFWTNIEPTLREPNATNEERAIVKTEHWKEWLKNKVHHET